MAFNLSLSDKRNSNLFGESASCLSLGIGVQRDEPTPSDFGEILGVLEVFVHRAIEIHDICIYHKQNVYAKVCLTSDPEIVISTKTISGCGRNPVFNDRVHLNVRTMETSLKCEIWMLSRVKKHEDRLLGFTLVPLCEVPVNNGKLTKEFPLSSTELLDSPAGFVQLSIAYNEASSNVFVIPSPAESYSAFINNSLEIPMVDSSPSSISIIEIPSVSLSLMSTPPPKNPNSFGCVNFDLEPKVKKQDFVDMYMKSMQEFTKSLEQLKLPLDVVNGQTSFVHSFEITPKNSSSRIFYGSNAFF